MTDMSRRDIEHTTVKTVQTDSGRLTSTLHWVRWSFLATLKLWPYGAMQTWLLLSLLLYILLIIYIIVILYY